MDRKSIAELEAAVEAEEEKLLVRAAETQTAQPRGIKVKVPVIHRTPVYYNCKVRKNGFEVQIVTTPNETEQLGHRVRLNGETIEIWPKNKSKNYYEVVWLGSIPTLQPRVKE